MPFLQDLVSFTQRKISFLKINGLFKKKGVEINNFPYLAPEIQILLRLRRGTPKFTKEKLFCHVF